jgi:hypothetical protein
MGNCFVIVLLSIIFHVAIMVWHCIHHLVSFSLLILALFQRAAFRLDKFDWLSNSEYCNLSVVLWRGESGHSMVNISMNQFDDFYKEMVSLLSSSSSPKFKLNSTCQFIATLKSQTSKKDDAYSNTIFKTNVDACKAIKGVVANFMVKVVAETIRDSINFPLDCPFKKLSFQSNRHTNKPAVITIKPFTYRGTTRSPTSDRLSSSFRQCFKTATGCC